MIEILSSLQYTINARMTGFDYPTVEAESTGICRNEVDNGALPGHIPRGGGVQKLL
jgi:hypothetical protein